MKKILIVEDDEVTSQHLKFCLTKLDYDVVAIASNTLQARSKIKIYKPELILLDISLDEATDGINLAGFITQTCQIPFIYLSSHSDSEFIKKAQETRPYGYLVKPFEPKSLHTTIQMAFAKFDETKEQKVSLKEVNELNERLQKLFVNKKEGQKKQEFSQGYSFEYEYLELTFEEKVIKLTKREKLAIEILLSQLGHTVSFEHMINYIWDDDSATYNSLRTLIWRLRAKLPTDLILSSSGQGYIIKA